jgi:hypothetical protein
MVHKHGPGKLLERRNRAINRGFLKPNVATEWGTKDVYSSSLKQPLSCSPSDGRVKLCNLSDCCEDYFSSDFLPPPPPPPLVQRVGCRVWRARHSSPSTISGSVIGSSPNPVGNEFVLQMESAVHQACRALLQDITVSTIQPAIVKGISAASVVIIAKVLDTLEKFSGGVDERFAAVECKDKGETRICDTCKSWQALADQQNHSISHLCKTIAQMQYIASPWMEANTEYETAADTEIKAADLSPVVTEMSPKAADMALKVAAVLPFSVVMEPNAADVFPKVADMSSDIAFMSPKVADMSPNVAGFCPESIDIELIAADMSPDIVFSVSDYTELLEEPTLCQIVSFIDSHCDLHAKRERKKAKKEKKDAKKDKKAKKRANEILSCFICCDALHSSCDDEVCASCKLISNSVSDLIRGDSPHASSCTVVAARVLDDIAVGGHDT